MAERVPRRPGFRKDRNDMVPTTVRAGETDIWAVRLGSGTESGEARRV